MERGHCDSGIEVGVNDQETLIDYQPTKEEELTRLTELVAKLTSEREALKEAPELDAFAIAEKKANKVLKQVQSLDEKIAKVEKELRKLNAISIEEPTENGFYLLTMSSVWIGHKKEVQTQIVEQLYIRVFGDWINAEDGGWYRNQRWNRHDDFSGWLAIDDDTVSATFVKIENLDEMPAELKQEQNNFMALTADDDEVEDDE